MPIGSGMSRISSVGGKLGRVLLLIPYQLVACLTPLLSSMLSGGCEWVACWKPEQGSVTWCINTICSSFSLD